MYRLIIIITINLLLTACSFGQSTCNYLGLKAPGTTPEIFAPGIISTPGKNEHTLTISSDGNEIYFTRDPERKTYVLKKDSLGWSTPQPAPFDGREAIFSASGSQLFFNNGDLWYIDNDSTKISTPLKLKGWVNTAAHEYYASLSKSGNLYFSRIDTDYAHIYVAEYVNGECKNVKRLPTAINEPGCHNFHPFISATEDFILFNSGRDEAQNGVDIYISFKDENENWGQAINLGATINSKLSDLCPTISPDGKYLFFTRYDHSKKTEIYTGFQQG